MDPLISVEQVSRSFPGVQALDRVDFSLGHGRVHALLGENGAGKSTLIKVLTGMLEPDAGSVHLDGEPLPLGSPSEAQRRGIRAVYQELNLVSSLSVRENICLGAFRRTRYGGIDWAEASQRARDALERIRLGVDLSRPVETLSVAEQQLVEIAYALSGSAKVLILDEPTSSLSQGESDRLFEVIRQLAGSGVGVIYVTHRLDEVEKLADEVTVLRDGTRVMTEAKGEWSRLGIVRAMVGQEFKSFEASRSVDRERSILQIKSLFTESGLEDVDLTVHAGEVAGAFGLVGSGLGSLGRSIFGAEPISEGSVIVGGQRAPRKLRPRSARRMGLGFLSEDRRRDGIVPLLSVRENATVAALESFAAAGWVSRDKELKNARSVLGRLRVQTPSLNQRVGLLSGGNQQKVLLARWLMTDPNLLLLAEPTRGVDVGAKAEIYRILDEVAEEGMGILILSTDAEEVALVCDRAVVLRRGRIVAEFDGVEITQQSLLSAATGADAPREVA